MILRNRTRLKPSHFLISMCFNTTIVKTVWYWHKKTHRPKNGEPKNKPIHMANKNLPECEEYQKWKRIVSSINGVGKTGYSHAKTQNGLKT